MPRIELENVTKRWGKFTAVENLSMVIEDREFITLLGPSGCGKTTTLRMIAGLETPTTGKITIGDQVVFDSEAGINVSPAKRDIGFLFQNYALWPHMTVYKNITFGLENLKWKKPEIEARALEVMQMLKIEEFRNRYPAELSGGQQQRVAIARTLAPRPKVLFMDEPLSNLDAKLRGEMRTELKRLHSDTNSTFVYVTHDQLEAMTLATRICLIEKGVMQQYDPPLTVYNKPNNLFVADFIGNPTMNFVKVDLKEVVSPKQLKLDFFGTEITYTSAEDIVLSKPAQEVEPQAEQPQAQPEAKADEAVAETKQEEVTEEPKQETATAKFAAPVLTLGIRPEFLPIMDNGAIQGTAYSTLPAGMETTVKIKINDSILSSVVFGSIDYAVDQEIKFNIVGNGIVLFVDKERVALGSVSVAGHEEPAAKETAEEKPAKKAPAKKATATKKAPAKKEPTVKTTTKKTTAKKTAEK